MTEKKFKKLVSDMDLAFDKNTFALQHLLQPREFLEAEFKSINSNLYKEIPSKYLNLFAKAFVKNNVRLCLTDKYAVTSKFLGNYCVPKFATLIFLSKADNLNDAGFYHEIGHILDTYYDEEDNDLYYYSSKHPIPTAENMTLNQVLRDELKKTKKVIFEEILEDYKNMVDEEFGKETFLAYEKSVDKILEADGVMRKHGGFINWFNNSMNNEEEDDIKDYNPIAKSEDYQLFNKVIDSDANYEIKCKYETVLDTLTGSMNLYRRYRLNMHDQSYYKNSKENLAAEFFANMVRSMVTENKGDTAFVKKYLPRSYQAFIDLYNYIVKRVYGLTDALCDENPFVITVTKVKTKKVSND